MFDPTDILISADGTDGASSGDILFGDPPTAEPWNVSAAQLDAVAGNVILQATNDIDFNQDVSLTTANASLTAQAGNNITLDTNVSITTTGGDIHLEADSPHAGGPAGGTITTSNPNSDLISNGGNITLIASDFDLKGDVLAGSGDISITTSDNSALGIGNGATDQLSQNELNTFSTSGIFTLGQATTAGTDGQGTGALDLTADSITFNNNVTLDADFTGQIDFTAANGITLDASLTFDTATTSVNLDSGSGAFMVGVNDLLTTTNNPLTITASDLDVNTGAVIDAGTAGINLIASNDGNLSIGTSQGGGEFNVSNAELGSITASSLDFTTTNTGDIFVDGATLAAANGNIGLSSGDTVLFKNTNTFPNTLSVTSTGTIADDPGASLQVTGTTTLNAGVSNILLDEAANDFTGAVSASGADIALTDANSIVLGDIDATGTLTVDAQGGTITQVGGVGAGDS
ncbi:MAG: hypothetical protein GWN45_02310, partial [Gammaproteobacteria bacterium]|nr:hypothetical protein [Gammaproteobacteria bacterium]